MKLIIKSMLLVLFFVSLASAHTLFMTVSDNEDGTITVEGMYSTGGVASNTDVRLEDSEGNILFEGKTDADGELEIKKPESPYIVILDGGPGHIAQERGL